MLDGTCIYRLEAYWSYELCVGQHVRQYHEDKYTEQGKKKTKLTEYFLGRVRCCPSRRCSTLPLPRASPRRPSSCALHSPALL